MHELAVADQSLDGAFFLESLCHADRPQLALQEAARVIRPGGRLVVVDGMMRNPDSATPAIARWLSRQVADHWAVPRFLWNEEFEGYVEQAGFETIDRQEIGWNIAPCVAHTPMLVTWHALRLMLTGRWSAWKRRHMIGCGLGVLLGLMRRQFGYFIYTLQRSGHRS